MREQILKMISEKVDEIFFDLQTENGIESGDIAPFDDLALENTVETLADIIERVIRYEMR